MDEILKVGRSDGLKTGLAYVTEKHTLGHTMRSIVERPNANTAWTTDNVEGTFQKANLTNAEKRRLENKYKPRRPPILFGYR